MPNPNDKILVLVHCSDMMEAERIARALLDLRLVACATVGARVRSHYWWKGEKREATEYPLILKTRQDRFTDVEREVRRLHSYETPEILAVPIVNGNDAYLKWIDECLSAPV